MKPSILARKLHYWAAILVAVPALVMMGSGLLLQAKKQSTWVQPAEQRGSGPIPQIGLDSILKSVAAVPAHAVDHWDDVNRIDVRPARGVAKVWLHSGWEVQVDLVTGVVLQNAYRRSDLIESIHDGSFFAGDWTKLGVFLPAGAILFGMLLTGLWLFIVPFVAKRRRARLAGATLPRG